MHAEHGGVSGGTSRDPLATPCGAPATHIVAVGMSHVPAAAGERREQRRRLGARVSGAETRLCSYRPQATTSVRMWSMMMAFFHPATLHPVHAGRSVVRPRRHAARAYATPLAKVVGNSALISDACLLLFRAWGPTRFPEAGSGLSCVGFYANKNLNSHIQPGINLDCLVWSMITGEPRDPGRSGTARTSISMEGLCQRDGTFLPRSAAAASNIQQQGACAGTSRFADVSRRCACSSLRIELMGEGAGESHDSSNNGVRAEASGSGRERCLPPRRQCAAHRPRKENRLVGVPTSLAPPC